MAGELCAAFEAADRADLGSQLRGGSLGKPAFHSCGGGPTFLSFVDDRHGWMEPVSPNGPAGALLRTTDGGQTWMQVASGPSGQLILAAGVLGTLELLLRSDLGGLMADGGTMNRDDDLAVIPGGLRSSVPDDRDFVAV